MKNGASSVFLMAAMLLALCCASPMTKYTFPKCLDKSKDCCKYGTEMMKHRGYTLVSYENNAMSVTCSHGELRCAIGNPNTMASYDGSKNVSCPNFTSMMEARSEIEYIEGVKEDEPNKTDGEAATGTVKPATLSR
ncbi:uncharacterized protein PHALS_06246 [Plasmopara halstedii]|uniref:RxLR-like protein n=1 Tax=Plasmopara halstedii TaxID=4781 RepID=A0A0P1B4B5_PLAHL|nr:uncharacterized protein PHALS_06246 [Plasmopara halstedii]CEG48422.1 hypothetical protein PHALS_06246 [Plasmopara halstedii]|eukprot:XP_024584791.1 hypothetical protein PHALS_06246 [Plasmopara halstedii]